MADERSENTNLLEQRSHPGVARVVSYRVLTLQCAKAVVQLAETGSVSEVVIDALKEAIRGAK